ncbi:glycosyltransferase family 2 protein [Nonomuraea rosea]|uniref:Glycosyltransferase family 2 protein n=2 Tax=Nonomuraea rosea TaxID=638574 RepID=A0ABP7A1C9_9ACTN
MRYASAGYSQPKPLISTAGRPMISVVLDCYPTEANFIFVIREEHIDLGLQDVLLAARPGATVIATRQRTAGPVQTALLARKFIDSSTELLVADCDSYLVWPFEWIWSWMRRRDADGGVTVRYSSDPACSYAAIDAQGWVTETREKDPFTPFSTTGPYWWRRGSDFVRMAEAVGSDQAINGEYYVSPLYNSLIAEGGQVLAYFLSEFWPLGVPADHNAFEAALNAV